MNMCDTVTGWCRVIFDHRGSSVLTQVSVSARKDKSLSVIRQWSSGALLTTDLVFGRPKSRLSDDDGPGLTSTPPMIRSSRMLWLSRVRRWQWKGGPVRSIDGHWFVERRPGDMRKNGERNERNVSTGWMCGFMAMKVVEKWEKQWKVHIIRWSPSAGGAEEIAEIRFPPPPPTFKHLKKYVKLMMLNYSAQSYIMMTMYCISCSLLLKLTHITCVSEHMT